MKEDVRSATTKPSCQHRQYKEEKLEWLVQQSQAAVLSWQEEKEGILESERKLASELDSSIHGIQEKAMFCKRIAASSSERKNFGRN